MNPLLTLEAARSALEEGAGPRDLLAGAAERNRGADAGERPLGAFLSTVGSGESAARRAAGKDATSPDSDPRVDGVPVAVKDNLCTLELPTTCGSKILEGFRSPYEATAVRKLRAAGMRIFGKTNMDEFAMGSSTENSAFHPTRNPVDPGRVPGGSSGGSAAAVAAGIVPVALGSDTGGSVRQPAAFCGVVGVKPTYGRVSRYGLVAFASSLDQVGVLAGSVRDAAVALQLVSGHDARDATSRDRPVPRAAAVDEVDLEGRVIGVPREYVGEGLDGGVRARLRETLDTLADAGVEVREVSLPGTEAAIPCYYVIAPAEASSNLARYDGVRYGLRRGGDGLEEMYGETRGSGFGREVKRRIMLGTFALSAGYYEAYYLRARRLQQAISSEFAEVFREVDALFTPTSPTPAFRLGERTEDPYRMYLSDVYTVSANLAGIPAVSLPIGDVEGLPVGGQLMCPAWEEERMLGLAARIEERVAYPHPATTLTRRGP